MIDTLAEKIPQISRVIQYEDIVADPKSALRIGADLCELPVTDVALPEIGDDRDCSKPYQALIAAALEQKSP